jgi:hypothetical protein
MTDLDALFACQRAVLAAFEALMRAAPHLERTEVREELARLLSLDPEVRGRFMGLMEDLTDVVGLTNAETSPGQQKGEESCSHETS